jgi:hypothetical protein
MRRRRLPVVRPCTSNLANGPGLSFREVCLVVSPHISPGSVVRAARRRAQWCFRPEGRGVVLDRTSSTLRRENDAGCGASPAAAGSW